MAGQRTERTLAQGAGKRVNAFLRRRFDVEIRRHGARAPDAVDARLMEAPARELTEKARATFSNTFPIAPTCPLTPEEAHRRLESYYWHYPFELGGRLYESDMKRARGLHGRHYRRYLHAFPALLAVAGGSLAGKTVLDVACNAGFWSIQARLAGADSVVGVEASAENVEQARLILDVTGLDGIRFEEGNAYELARERHGEFDVALYMGLLYHLEHPVLALERLFDVTRELAVVDTTVAPGRSAALNLQADRVHEQNYANPIAAVPTRRAVALMLRRAGFAEVLVVPRTSDDLPPDYREGRRETFIAVR